MPKLSDSRNCRICSWSELCYIYRLCHARTLHTTCPSCAPSCRIRACNALRLLNPCFCMWPTLRILRYVILALSQYLSVLRLTPITPFGRIMGYTRFLIVHGLHQDRFVDTQCFDQVDQLLGRRENFTLSQIRQHWLSTVRRRLLRRNFRLCATCYLNLVLWCTGRLPWQWTTRPLSRFLKNVEFRSLRNTSTSRLIVFVMKWSICV